MLRVTSGSALNKAGSKNVNYWLIFCFAPYSHQEKWNASESPEHKWKSVRTIALSYFGYAIKWNINILRVHSSTPQPVAVWAGINVISELSPCSEFSRQLREQEKLSWGAILFTEESTSWTSEGRHSSCDCKEKGRGMRNSLPFPITY